MDIKSNTAEALRIFTPIKIFIPEEMKNYLLNVTISQKNILHHKILESYTELSDLIRISSSLTFAVIRSLVLKSSTGKLFH